MWAVVEVDCDLSTHLLICPVIHRLLRKSTGQVCEVEKTLFSPLAN